MPAVKVRVPAIDRPFYSEGAITPASVKERLVAALAQLDTLPAPRQWAASNTQVDAVTVWLSAAQYEAVVALGRAHRIDGLGPAAGALLHGWAHAERLANAQHDPVPVVSDQAKTTLDRVNEALGNQTRHDQAIFYGRLAGEIRTRRKRGEVIFAEASTGIGKTRACMAAMVDWCLAHPGEVTVLASPSYNVLLQSLHQWSRIASAIEVPDSITLLGQQEYVSAFSLKQLLQEQPEIAGADKAKAWLDGGGKAPEDDPLGHPWLLRSLRVATEDEWLHDTQVQLGSDNDDDDPGMLAYRAQFTDARDVSVVFCTHSMLAVDVRLRSSQARKAYLEQAGAGASNAAWLEWGQLEDAERKRTRTWELQNDLLAAVIEKDNGRLPPIGLLVVDEAHLLEESFARVFANGFSIASLRAALAKLRAEFPRLVAASDVAEISDIWSDLKSWGERKGLEAKLAKTSPALIHAVDEVRTILRRVLDRKIPKTAMNLPALRQLVNFKRNLDVAALSAGDRSGMATRISWSSSASWPSIEVGRYDVSRELDFLWSLSVRDRSVLVSATLFDDMSLQGMETARRMLSVRAELARPISPVRPGWLYDPVTLYMPADTVHADGLPRFRRPGRRERDDPVQFAEQEARWRRDILKYVGDAYSVGVGGMLVLMTSYKELDVLCDGLAEHIAADCLIRQIPGKGQDAMRSQFIKTVAEGRRPCLVAVGSAWTGLDLSGDALGVLLGRPLAPEDDNVLTDLVIPTTPFGTVRTLTHAWRKERTGMVAEVAAMSIMFRQGIGRLIRRDNLPHNRKLHFLDSRIHAKEWGRMLHPATKALAPYMRRVLV